MLLNRSLQLVAMIKIGSFGNNTFCKVINKTLWLIGTSRNAILVVISGFIGYSFYTNGPTPFRLIGFVPPGLPEVKPPPFSFTGSDNTTVTFVDMVSGIGPGIVVVPLIALLENISICKAFGKFDQSQAYNSPKQLGYKD